MYGISQWLISEGRLSGCGKFIVEGYAARLVQCGIPLFRINVSQRFANPLLAAWGVVWTAEETREYNVSFAILETSTYLGGPFEQLNHTKKPVRQNLIGLNRETTHSSYLDFADAGGTDYYATPMFYSDGSTNGCTFVTDHPEGFSDEHIELIDATVLALAAAMEAVTLRRSMQSLLKTYLGDGPAEAVVNGTVQLGEYSEIEAVVMFTDLRGFTAKSEQWSESRLLNALNGYFDIVVRSVEDNGGDVLKFIGDGILSIFPVAEPDSRVVQCGNSINASVGILNNLKTLNKQRETEGECPLLLGIGINVGMVAYGNIGSPTRLDFTVLGSTVNIASRVQDLCKKLNEPVLVTRELAELVPEKFSQKGRYSLVGVSNQAEVHCLKELSSNTP